jgi:hypothetical protein
MTSLVLLTLLSATTVQDILSGAEFGDASVSVFFGTTGQYKAEQTDKKGSTKATGTWKLEGGELAVKVDQCKGPACATTGASFKATVTQVGDRAMTIRASAGPVPTGSYYCKSHGCERRVGIEVAGRAMRVPAIKHVVDVLIAKNRDRDSTVVWWAKPLLTEKQPVSTLEVCTRDAEQAKKGADLVKADLAELEGMSALEATPSADTSCLWDVRLNVGDKVPFPKP